MKKEKRKEYTTRYVAPTLKLVLRQIRSNRRHLKKQCYKKLNKKYKLLNWNEKFFTATELRDAIEDDYFKCWRRMYADKELRPMGNRPKIYYSRENAEMICLLKEVAAFTESGIDKIKKVKHKKVKYLSFYFESKYIGKRCLFVYPESRKWKEKPLRKYLKTKEFLFNEDSPFYKGWDKTVQFIFGSLMCGKMEKWDFYLKRFLEE